LSILRVLIAITALTTSLVAESITGTIVIKKKLTKPGVTASVSIYQRGPAVELGKDADSDPLALERSRVVIWLEGPGPVQEGGFASGKVTLSMQQLGRQFSPNLLVVPAGSTVSFPNMDPIFHNVFSLSKPKAFDLGNYPKGDSRSVVFSKPGIVSVNCHLHPNMAATIVVTPNQWYAKVDRSGRFEVSGLTPGRYTIVAWHKAAGFFRRSVVIEAGHEAVTSFFIPLGPDEPQMLPERVSENK
jgi:plastocyanin